MKKPKRKFWKWLYIVLLAVAFSVGVTLAKIYSDIQRTFEIIQTPVEVKTVRHKKVEVEKGDPINILLLGSDSDSHARKEEDGYVSRTDTLIIVSLNPQTRTTKMLSIPRDTYTLIAGQAFPDKMNHSYAYGGIELTIETVQEYLDIPIDYYAVINMEGLAQLIDAVGGISVTSPLTFNYRGTGFVKGETREVNGVKAMNFARMRYDDPEGEIGRQNRQKMVIKAVIDKVLTLDSVANYPKLLRVVADNIQTNLDLNQAMTLMRLYLPAFDNITSIKFEDLEELYVEGVFYFYIPLSSRVKVSNEIRQQSGMPSIVATNLADPLDNDDVKLVTKTAKIILNQFPTGVTEEQLGRILQSQGAVQAVREAEYYVPPYIEYVVPGYVPPITNVNVPPVQSSSIETPSSAEPAPPVQPETPPVISESPVEAPPAEPVVPVEPPVSNSPSE